MAVGYIAEGDSISAARLTTLFADFDGKVAELLSGKSPFLFQDPVAIEELRNLLGCIYYFCNGAVLPYLEAWGAQNYDHSKFYQWRDAVTEGLLGVIHRNEDNKTTVVTAADPQVDLGGYGGGATQGDLCLEALRLGEYYIAEYDPSRGVIGYQQKRYRYAVAEMVYEGKGYEAVRIPRNWNKFNFFRFHNLNPYRMVISFQDGPEGSTITVDPYSCVAVRRDSVASGYDASYRYFWKFNPQDPRGYTFPRAWVGAWYSQAANPIINPCILYSWVSQFDGYAQSLKMGGVCWYRDIHNVFDVSGIYSDYFGNPVEPSTILGDLLHHKGTIRTTYTEDGEFKKKDVEFRGYQNIQSDLAQASITVTDEGQQLVLASTLANAEMHGIGTNLFYGSNVGITGINLVTAKPNGVGVVMPLAQSSAPKEYQYTGYNLATGTIIGESVSLPFTGLLYERVGNDSLLPIWKTTVSETLSLNHFGSDTYKFTSQNTEVGSFVDRTFRLTITGLKLHFSQRFLLNCSFGGEEDIQDVVGIVPLETCSVWGATPLQATLDAAVAVLIKRELSFDGYGWPASGSKAPAFLTPRRDRAYSNPHFNTLGGLMDWKHPNMTGLPVAPNGADYDETWNGCDYVTISGRALVPLTLEPQPYTLWPTWINPDDIYSVVTSDGRTDFPKIMPRLFLLRELYNDMAATVNSITGCFPLDYRFLKVDLGDGVTVASFEPNSVGITGSTLRPMSQYASFPDGSVMHQLCVKLHVPLKTEADFPQSYRDVIAERGHGKAVRYVRRTWGRIITRPLDSYFDSSPYILLDGASSGLMTEFGSFDPVELYSIQSGAVFGQEPYLWVAIEDVRRAAGEYGFRFIFRDLSIPWTIERFEVTPTGAGSPGDPPEGSVSIVETVLAEFFGPIWALIPAVEEAEWKTSSNTPTLSDYRPGDALCKWVNPTPIITVSEYQPPGGIPINSEGTEFLRPAKILVADLVEQPPICINADLPAELLAEIPQCRQQQIQYRRAAVYQRYVTEGSSIANGTKIVMNQIPWLGHPSEDFSAQSIDNARIASVAGLPLEVKSAMGVSLSTDVLDEGETYIQAAIGKAKELAVFLADQVPLT
jgi:hypothetical protein